MNILFITFIPPEKTSGGAIGIRQSLLSLLSNGNNIVDYVGPYTSDSVLDKCRKKYYYKKDNSIISRLYHAVRYKACSVYAKSWESIENELDWERYDVVNLERSLNFYIVDSAKKYSKYVIVRFHNIECDYYDNVYRHNGGIINKIKSYIAFYYEKNIAKCADALIPITEKDAQRIGELYSAARDKMFINPVCVASVEADLSPEITDLPSKYYLVTGSLWYGPNADGIMWFIDNVWREVVSSQTMDDVYLIVAGGKPNQKLRDKVNMSVRVRLVDTPDDIDPYFRNAYAYIAPIFNGAGMKVKIAEALSYGLNVYGTKHAFIGYEHTRGVHLINTKKEFYSAIVNEDSRVDSRIIKDDFEKKYSLNHSIQFYNKLLSNFAKMDKIYSYGAVNGHHNIGNA